VTNKILLLCIIAELTDLEKLQKKVEGIDTFINLHNNVMHEMLSKSSTFDEYKTMTNDYYTLCIDEDLLSHWQKTDADSQPFEDFLWRIGKTPYQKLFGGKKNRKNRKNRI